MTKPSSKKPKTRKDRSDDPHMLLSSLSDDDFMQALTRRIIESSLGIRITDDPNDSMAVSRQIVEGLHAAQATRDNKLELATEMSSMIHKLVLESLLNAEMEQYLGKPVGKTTDGEQTPSGGEEGDRPVEVEAALRDDSGTRPARAGKNCRTARAKSGGLSGAPDRSPDLHAALMPEGKVTLCNSSEKILQLAAMGHGVRDIVALFKQMLDVDIPCEYVQSVLDHFHPRLRAWQERELKPFYPFVFTDCLSVPIRTPQGLVSSTPVHLILGIDMDGKKELLGLEILEEADEHHGWGNIFARLRDRGLKDMLFVCMDGARSVEEVLRAVFPDVILQRSITHLVLDSCRYVASRDRKAWCADLKRIYAAPDQETGLAALVQLGERWAETVPAGVDFWERHFDKDVSPLYGLHPAIRRLIYTTNAIESVDTSLRSVVKKGRYDSQEGALTAMILRADRVLGTNWARRAVQHWSLILGQLRLHERTRDLMARYEKHGQGLSRA